MAFEKTSQDETTTEPKELPQVSPNEIRKIQSQIPKVRHDISRLLKHLDNLRNNYPEEFAKINSNHPQLAKSIDQIKGLVGFLGEENSNLSNEEIIQTMNEYNLYAHEINTVLKRIDREVKEDRENILISAAHGELPFDEAEFTTAQKEELRAFAQDLWKELFPESGVDQFVKWSTGQKDLDGYQKVLIAPANGIESAVVGFINLFKPNTYKELYVSIETISGLNYEDWCDLWRGLKFTYEQLPTTDKIAPVLSLICAIAFLTGSAEKITQMAQKMEYSTVTVNAIRSVFAARLVTNVLNPAGKAFPLGTILGITLPYIKPEES